MAQMHNVSSAAILRSVEDELDGGASGLHRHIAAIPAKEESKIRLVDVRANDNVVGDELERIVEAIESAAKTINALNEKIASYEMTIFDLTAQVAEMSVRQDAAAQQAARAEFQVLAEMERAATAEARAKASEDRLNTMERRETATKERLGRVTTAVSNLLAAGDNHKYAPFAMAS